MKNELKEQTKDFVQTELKEITLKKGEYGTHQHLVYWIYYSGEKTSYKYHYADEIVEWIEKYLEQGYRIIIEKLD